MKIGFICHDAFPIKQPFQGGLEMITYLLVEEFVKRGHDVISLCLEGSELSGEMVYYSELENLNRDLPEELISLGSVTHSLNNFLQRNFDVVQNHSLHYQSIILGNLSNHNFVTTFHTPVFPYLDLGIKAIVENPKQKFIGVSNSLSALYQEMLPNVQTIYNGIDVSIWDFNLNDAQDYYSWCGRICKEKGLAQLMGLCLQADIKLKIAGPISNELYFREQIEPLLELGNFEYVGHLNQSQVNKHVKHSKAYIFSSVWEEPYGLVIAEALACGTPVLANNVGASSEIVTASSGYLYDINNVNSFLEGIKAVNNIDRLDCRKRAEEFCSHTVMVDHYESLYCSFTEVSHLEKAV